MGNAVRWAVGVLTCARERMLLADTVLSLVEAGWDRGVIHVDGRMDLPRGLVGDWEMVVSEKRLGAWDSWYLTMLVLVSRFPDADVYMICEDDLLLSRGLREYLESSLWPSDDVAFCSPYCPGIYGEGKRGWFRIEGKSLDTLTGSLCYLFPPDSIRMFLEDMGGVEASRNVDFLHGKWALKRGRSVWYHKPSLIQHTGIGASTLGNEDVGEVRRNRKAFDFSERIPEDLWSLPERAKRFPIKVERGKVSVLLCTHKKLYRLKEQLEAVNNQTVTPQEIRVWHGGPLPFPKDVDVDLIETRRPQGVWPRMWHCLDFNTEFVAVLDDDVIPGRRWLENCFDCHDRSGGMICAGGFIYPDGVYDHRKYCGTFLGGDFMEVDHGGNAWFFRRDWVWAFVWEPKCPCIASAGEDMHLSVALQKQLGIRTYLSPYPPGDKSLWGTLGDRSYSDDENALWKRPGEIRKRRMAFEFYRAGGWKLLYERKK